jgi:hypothetical protein
MKKMETLVTFEQNIKENLSKIDLNVQMVNENRQLIMNFRNEDLFINSKNNYEKVYTAMMKLN